MIDARGLAKEIQDQMHSQVRKGQDSAASALRTWLGAAQSVQPQLRGWSVPAVRLPVLTDLLPSPKTLVSSAFDLAEQLLAAQRKLAERLVRELTEQRAKPAEPAEPAEPILIDSAAVFMPEPMDGAGPPPEPAAAAVVEVPAAAVVEVPAAAEIAVPEPAVIEMPAAAEPSQASKPSGARKTTTRKAPARKSPAKADARRADTRGLRTNIAEQRHGL